jgi:transposase-like protein
MRFPIKEILNEEESYQYLRRVLQPERLRCPNGHRLPPDQAAHKYSKKGIPSYRCRECGRVYNIFTDTVWARTHYDCRTIVLVMRGIVQGHTTAQIAEELGLDYETLLNRRHKIQATGEANLPP